MTKRPPPSEGLPVRELSSLESGRSFILYGKSGTGKTTLASTFPKPLLYLDVRDRGTDSIADVKGIKALSIETFEEFEKTYWWLKKNPKAYATVVIDTTSQLQQIAFEEHLSSKKKKTEGVVNAWGALTRKDWGEIASLMKEWLINYRDLCDLGLHVVFIAQERAFNLSEEEDDDEGVLAPEIGPSLSPSVARTLNASVSLITNTFIRSRTIERTVEGKKKKSEKIEYCARLGPHPVFITRIRKPRSIEIPSVLANPTYEELMALIKGEA